MRKTNSQELTALLALVDAPDPRLPASRAAAALRSINLAISARGIAAIRTVAPESAVRVLQDAIPMKGRMVHDGAGHEQSQLYDPDGQVRLRALYPVAPSSLSFIRILTDSDELVHQFARPWAA